MKEHGVRKKFRVVLLGEVPCLVRVCVCQLRQQNVNVRKNGGKVSHFCLILQIRKEVRAVLSVTPRKRPSVRINSRRSRAFSVRSTPAVFPRGRRTSSDFLRFSTVKMKEKILSLGADRGWKKQLSTLGKGKGVRHGRQWKSSEKIDSRRK